MDPIRPNRRQVLQSGVALAAVPITSCSNADKSQYLFNFKGPIEQIVNPFGDPWASRFQANPSIPVATSSLLALFSRGNLVETGRINDQRLHMSRDFVNYHQHASSPYHYDESVAKISEDMPSFRQMRKAFLDAGLTKKFIGYSTVNFAESERMAGYRDAPERFFLHYKGMPETRENRIVFRDKGESGDVYDIRLPECREYLAQALTKAMVINNVDAVLLDYSASEHAFGSITSSYYPDDWFPIFEEIQYAMLGKVTQVANSKGKEVFCNGVTLDGLYITSPEKTDLFVEACNGAFWEQPFRDEWRDVGPDPNAYYDRLEKFFAIGRRRDRKFFIKQGTYRYTGIESDAPGWNWRFAKTSYEKERRLAEYLLAFYLLYSAGELTPLIYTHPVIPNDIFASEAYFSIFDLDVGMPLAKSHKLADHVYCRLFSKAIVVLNNSDDIYRGAILEGSQLSGKTVSLPPQSGKIIPY